MAGVRIIRPGSAYRLDFSALETASVAVQAQESYRQNLSSRRQNFRKNLTESFCFWAPDFPEYEYEIVVEHDEEAKVEPEKPVEIGKLDLNPDSKNVEIQADILSELEIPIELTENNESPINYQPPHSKIRTTTEKIVKQKTKNEVIRPTTAPLRCSPGGRPKFCSYYALGNRHDSVSQKRTFNVKSSIDVYPTAKWVRNPIVMKAKADQLTRVPKPKTSVADAPYNRWMTTNQIELKNTISMASLRNRGPILETFKTHLNINEQAAGNFLSIAEGDGHHIEIFAKHFNQMTFHPTEFDQKRINYTNHYLSKLSNVKPCQFLDSSKPENWSLTEIPDLSNHFDYILNVNMIHISTWESTVGLFKGCSKVLKPDGVLVTYGPYAENGILEPASNRQFDESLRSNNSAWGIRDVSELQKLAGLNGMNLFEKVPMESNNYCLLFKKC